MMLAFAARVHSSCQRGLRLVERLGSPNRLTAWTDKDQGAGKWPDQRI